MELTKLITHYDRYAPIWNTDKAAFIRRYANTKRPLSSFDLDITRYKNNQSDIQSEDVTHGVGFIKVDCSLLKAALVSHCHAVGEQAHQPAAPQRQHRAARSCTPTSPTTPIACRSSR